LGGFGVWVLFNVQKLFQFVGKLSPFLGVGGGAGGGDGYHFGLNHFSSVLLRELGACGFNHCFKFFARLPPIFFGSYKG